jgi:hypothetical protein
MAIRAARRRRQGRPFAAGGTPTAFADLVVPIDIA